MASPRWRHGVVAADGIDFLVMSPKWLAVGLFVALPALFGAAIGGVVYRVSEVPDELAFVPAFGSVESASGPVGRHRDAAGKTA